MILEYLCTSPEKTRKLARSLAAEAKRGSVFALVGELGTGKTLFTKAFAASLGITEDITSPTFTLLEEYDAVVPLYHFDLYRIEHDAEFDFLDFEDYWEGSGISLIEWADRAGERLPDNTVYVSLEYVDEMTRRITVEYPDS